MLIKTMRNRTVMQNSWVVDDIDAAMRHWITTCGIGPFFVVKELTLDDLWHRGRPTDAICTIALAQAGDVQIELVQQLNDAGSAYRDTVPKGQSAFHHIAFYSHDYDKDLADYTSQGFDVAYNGAFAGKRFCYIDTSATIGCMVELIEESTAQAEFFARIRAAAENWDGSDPIRPAF